MKISLIVTTQGNREEEVNRLLKSIEEQTYKEYEVIFVDQSSEAKYKYLSELYYIKYINTEKISLSKARNIAIKAATGDVIGLSDDDCWYPNNALENVFNNLLKSNVDVICGKVIDKDKNKNYKEAAYQKIIKIEKKNSFKYPTSAGIFVKVKNLGHIKFDENLGVGCKWGCGEEVDLILNLLYLDYNIYYDDELVIYHPVEEVNINNLNKYYLYAKGFGATVGKHFDSKNVVIINDLLNVIFRSLVAVVVFFIQGNKKYKVYGKRVSGAISGFLEGRSFYRRNR